MPHSNLIQLVWSCLGWFLVNSICVQSFIGGFSGVKFFQDVLGHLMDVLLCFWCVSGRCRWFNMFRMILEGFRWFKVAVNNTQLSQRATWKCSRRTSPFKFSFCSLPSTMLSMISAGWIWGGCVTGVTHPLHLPSHAVLRLSFLRCRQ